MKKHFNKTARHGHAYRVGLGIYSLGQGYYGSPTILPVMPNDTYFQGLISQFGYKPTTIFSKKSSINIVNVRQ